jgi:hypothetical protein
MRCISGMWEVIYLPPVDENFDGRQSLEASIFPSELLNSCNS